MVLFGGMALVSQLATAHATAAGWGVGTALTVVLIILITSAVRTSSAQPPDLPHTRPP